MKFLIAVLVISLVAANELPEKFLGTWDIEDSVNFDEYLTAKGYNWFMRVLIRKSHVAKVFAKNKDGTYTAEILTQTKSAHWNGWRLDLPFDALYLDEEMHRITFSYNNATDVFSETHKTLERESPDENCLYTINQAGRLVMEIEFGGVKSQRFYAKKE
ncbi:putative effector protein [Aphelenchoides besseyi]|nr:putative effector protein [Aphelenchoides besseyi]KAI6208922.1 putative effector protein [Aphelenchoides besseyi]